MAKKKTKKKYQWFIEIHEPEYSVLAFPSPMKFLEHVANNGPITGGLVDVDKRTDDRLKKAFKNKNVAAVHLSWDKYAPDFGFTATPTGH